MTKKQIGYLILVFALLCVAHFFGIENKSIHHDESINGWFMDQISINHYYKYDPTNYHGPFFFYYEKLVESILGRGHVSLRYGTVFFAIMTWLIVTAWGLRRNNLMKFIGPLMGLSPAVLFFGRSGIHETLFVFFQILAMIGFLEWKKYGSQRGLVILLYSLAGAAFNKETIVISIAVAGIATVMSLFLTLPGTLSQNVKEIFRLAKSWWNDLMKVSWWLHGPIILFCFWALYTGGGKNQSGIFDFFVSYFPWMKTGSHGAGHEKVWYYWLELIGRYEIFISIGILAALAGIVFRIGSKIAGRKQITGIQVDPLALGISLFALGVLAIYSAIPYKTVWCILTLVWPFAFVVSFFDWKGFLRKSIVWISAAGILYGIGVTWSALYVVPINYDHKYVYVQTLPFMTDFVRFIHKKAHEHTGSVSSAAADAWPLPYVFGDLPKYYYQNETLHVLDLNLNDALVAMVDEPLMTEEVRQKFIGWPLRIFRIRESRVPFYVYFRPQAFTEAELDQETYLEKSSSL